MDGRLERICNLEAGFGLFCGFKGGDGLDEASNGEGIANAARVADQVQGSALPCQGYGQLHQHGNPGAVDLRNIIEVDNDLAGARLRQFLDKGAQMLAGIADGEPAMDDNKLDPVRFAHGHFQGWMQGHRSFPQDMHKEQGRRLAVSSGAAQALYDEGYGEQANKGAATSRVECDPEAST